MRYLVLFVVVCTAVSAQEIEKADNLTEVEKAFIDNEIDAKILILPQNKLHVHYGEDIKVNLGEELEPRVIVDAPTVMYDADPEAHYTLIMADLDSPTRKKPVFSEVVLWLVVNIPGSKVHKGDTIVEYSGHQPSRKGEVHRRLFLLFKQHSKQVFNEAFIPSGFTFFQRIGFSIAKFAIKYQLGNPVSGNFFQVQHDESFKPEHHWGQWKKN